MAAHMSMKQALMDPGDELLDFAHPARQMTATPTFSGFSNETPFYSSKFANTPHEAGLFPTPQSGGGEAHRMSFASILSDSITSNRRDDRSVGSWSNLRPQHDHIVAASGQLESTNWQSRLDDMIQKPFTNQILSLVPISMVKLGYPPACTANPRLYMILRKMNRDDLFQKVLAVGVTDLWLPLPRRLVRKWLANDQDVKSYLMCQEQCLDDGVSIEVWGRHFALTEADDMGFDRVRLLGAGGFGEVHEVKDRWNGETYACKTMARPVKYERHLETMRNFTNEVLGMRRVHHQYCVRLVASGTDLDSVILLSSPVASMDLSHYLDSALDQDQLRYLHEAIGCISSALAYLHGLHIR